MTSEKEIQISASLARGLLVRLLVIKNQKIHTTTYFHMQYLVDVIVGYLSSQDQWELLQTTILTILKHDCYEEGILNVDNRV